MENLRKEEEIIGSWDKCYNGPIVSICCATYNHEDFIEDTIRGFLNQRTSFPIEILIHDDASLDGTQEIIKHYEQRYPNIIKAILQKTNKHSLGITPNFEYNFPRAKGKYIALCEGDDYWINSSKLAIQIEIMTQDKDCTISYHSAIELDMNTNQTKIISSNLGDSGYDNVKNVILERGSYIPTASIVFTNKDINQIYKYVKIGRIGDYFVQVIKALEGNCYFIKREMSVYRRNVKGSWTTKQNKSKNSRDYSFNMIKAIGLLRKDPMVGLNSKYFESVYCFYAIMYIKNSIGVFNKFKAFLKLQKESLSKGYYLSNFDLIKYICKKSIKRCQKNELQKL